MRSVQLLLGTTALVAVGLGLAAEKSAQACGGCFTPPQEAESVITDHRMVLSISSKQTTLYDQIRYSGKPSSFAWVLPISGTATVGLSSDTVFRVLDANTATVVQQPPLNCPQQPSSCNASSFGGTGAGAPPPNAGTSNDAGVQVTRQETVGPYETVQLHSTDPQALNNWLATNGFSVPPDVSPIISKYVTEKFDFLALKLKPGAGVSSMRPVRVTTAGASPVLPLRMVAAGTGATVGITLWVLGEGRYEPQNFPFFHIASEDIVWDWATSSSNFKTLRAAKEAGLAGRGWEIESSVDLSRSTIESSIRYGYYGNGGGGPVGPNARDAGPDYLPVQDDAGTVTETSDQVRDDDLTALTGNLPGDVARITRIRSDLNHASLNLDLALQASQDQKELSTLRLPTKESGQPQCPIYNGCDMVGTGTRDEANAAAQNNAKATGAGAQNPPVGTGSFSCNASTTSAGAPLGLLAAAGFLGFAAFRSRRRRG